MKKKKVVRAQTKRISNSKRSGVYSNDSALDLKIFIEILASALESGLDLTNACRRFAMGFSQNQVAQAFQNQFQQTAVPELRFIQDPIHLSFENVISALRIYPNKEATFIASVLQLANGQGAVVTSTLRGLLPFIAPVKKRPSTLSHSERISLYRYLHLTALGLRCGLSVENSWILSDSEILENSFLKKMTSTRLQNFDLVGNLFDLATKRGDSFLLSLSQIIGFQKEVGGNLATSLCFMAELIRPATLHAL